MVALQVFDTPGDPKFAPLASVFNSAANFAMILFDVTSIGSFEAVERYRRGSTCQMAPAAAHSECRRRFWASTIKRLDAFRRQV